MKEYIAVDVHKRYSFLAREEGRSGKRRHLRVIHSPGAIRRSLKGAAPGTVVAVEATGNWYWVVDEIEAAGLEPALVHPYKAKVMMGCVNKTDRLDADGMNRLQRAGTLPRVWIAPKETRDLRELPRTRMFYSHERTMLKNRILATLTKYNLHGEGPSDPFGKAGRRQLRKRMEQLPQHTRFVAEQMMDSLESLEQQIAALEKQIDAWIDETPLMRRLMTLPGIGRILATVIALEIGSIERFPSADRLASYSGTTPRVQSSGGKTRYGRLRADVNRYLKWAFIEAGNCVRLQQSRYPTRHVTQLYQRIAKRRGHAKAVGAVARHLAEAAWHVLRDDVDYEEPAGGGGVRSGGRKRETLMDA